jgi:hypothetical protein
MLYSFKQYKGGILIHAAEDSETGEIWVSSATMEELLNGSVQTVQNVINSDNFRRFAGTSQPRSMKIRCSYGIADYYSMDTYEMLRDYLNTIRRRQ